MHQLQLTILPLSLLCSCAVPLPIEPERAAPDDSPLRGAVAAPNPGDAALASSPARQEPAMRRRPMNYFDISFGASYWDDLGDLDPSGTFPIPGRFGTFDSWGSAFDIGYDRVISDDGRSAVSLGIESGWSTFDNNGSGLSSPYSDISATMFYIAPVVRWHNDLGPAVTVSPGIGIGYYGLSIDEYETYYYGWWYGYDTRTLYDDSTIGGFVSLAFDFRLGSSSAIRIDNKFHFAEFNGLEQLMPNESSVSGSIYTIGIGFVFAL